MIFDNFFQNPNFVSEVERMFGRTLQTEPLFLNFGRKTKNKIWNFDFWILAPKFTFFRTENPSLERDGRPQLFSSFFILPIRPSSFFVYVFDASLYGYLYIIFFFVSIVTFLLISGGSIRTLTSRLQVISLYS